MDTFQSEQELKKIITILRKGQKHKIVSIIPDLTSVLKFLAQNRAEQEMKKIALCTRAILQSFQSGDFVFMADIVEFELFPLINKVCPDE